MTPEEKPWVTARTPGVGGARWAEGRREFCQHPQAERRSKQALGDNSAGFIHLAVGPCVLDAGAGFGTATFALLDSLRHRCIEPHVIDAFDLTPAMLEQFQAELDARGVRQIRLKQGKCPDTLAIPAIVERLRLDSFSFDARVLGENRSFPGVVWLA